MQAKRTNKEVLEELEKVSLFVVTATCNEAALDMKYNDTGMIIMGELFSV